MWFSETVNRMTDNAMVNRKGKLIQTMTSKTQHRKPMTGCRKPQQKPGVKFDSPKG